MWMKIGWVLALLLVAGTGIAGVYNVIAELPDARTPLQTATSVGVGAYGVLGLAAAVGLLLRRRWALIPTLLWAIAITAVAVMAPIAYAPAAGLLGVLAGGVVTVTIGAAVYFMVRRVLREGPLR